MTADQLASSHVFYRRLTRRYPRIVRGDGCWLYDDAGRAYLDAVGGAFVVNVGHGVREIADAIGRQAARLAYVNGTAFTSDPVEELADEIARRSPGDLERVFFSESGSVAVEIAMKMERLIMGEPNSHVGISIQETTRREVEMFLASADEPEDDDDDDDGLQPDPTAEG